MKNWLSKSTSVKQKPHSACLTHTFPRHFDKKKINTKVFSISFSKNKHGRETPQPSHHHHHRNHHHHHQLCVPQHYVFSTNYAILPHYRTHKNIENQISGFRCAAGK